MRNTEVPHSMSKELGVVHYIKRSKLEYMGHLLRHERHIIPKIVIQGKIKPKRTEYSYSNQLSY